MLLSAFEFSIAFVFPYRDLYDDYTDFFLHLSTSSKLVPTLILIPLESASNNSFTFFVLHMQTSGIVQEFLPIFCLLIARDINNVTAKCDLIFIFMSLELVSKLFILFIRIIQGMWKVRK